MAKRVWAFLAGTRPLASVAVDSASGGTTAVWTSRFPGDKLPDWREARPETDHVVRDALRRAQHPIRYYGDPREIYLA